MAPRLSVPNLSVPHEDTVETVRSPAAAARSPATEEENNERIRNLLLTWLAHLSTTLNVLVIGGSGAGKSSLINSLNMALTKKWSDRAKYFPGRRHVIDECVLINNRESGAKVIFWDTRGFEEIHADDHATLIIKYVLEGRIPAKCIPCVLLMSKQKIKKRYHNTCEPRRKIDLVLNVSALDQEPQSRLMALVEQAILTSKSVSSKKIPIVSVATKSDVLSDDQKQDKLARLKEYSLENLVNQQRSFASSHRRGNLSTFAASDTRVIVNYGCELEPWSDESVDPSSVESSPDRDMQLLFLWRDIMSRTGYEVEPRKRAHSAASSMNPINSCLPFRKKANASAKKANASAFRERSQSY